MGAVNQAPIHVANGAFDQKYRLSAIPITAGEGLAGYDATPNPGGAYKVWVSRTSAFASQDCKTDNFKVKTRSGGGALDLTASMTAEPSFTRTYAWGISKGVDKTSVKQLGAAATFDNTVRVWQTGSADRGWAVNSAITVHNPNAVAVTGVAVTDGLPGAVVSGGAGLTVPAGGDVTVSYSKTYDSAPGADGLTNTATATWPAIGSPSTSATGSAAFAFTGPTTLVRRSVTIRDTFDGTTTPLGTLTATDAAPFCSATFTYARTVPAPTWDRATHTNTATIVATGQSAAQAVSVVGPMRTGALTMGFWQNKNGQAVITGSGAGTGVWFRQYAPFQDLSATATAAQTAAYVTAVIKGAVASGASMNAVLKGQMLAAAPNVYFSDPALGGNKINALSSIGARAVDLTRISAVGASSFADASSVFGGAYRTVGEMLAFAASQAGVSGSDWYHNVTSDQQLAADAFGAVDNVRAFSAP